MCGGLEGSYVLAIEAGACEGPSLASKTPAKLVHTPLGYQVESPWLTGCELRSVRPGSCDYTAACSASPAPLRKAYLQVRRNQGGFYGTLELGEEKCELHVRAKRVAEPSKS